MGVDLILRDLEEDVGAFLARAREREGLTLMSSIDEGQSDVWRTEVESLEGRLEELMRGGEPPTTSQQEQAIDLLTEGLREVRETLGALEYTKTLRSEIKQQIEKERPPETMVQLVRQTMAARRIGRSLHQDLEYMAVADGEAGFGGELLDTPEVREGVSLFAWSREQLSQMRAGVLDEAPPDDMVALVREGMKAKGAEAPGSSDAHSKSTFLQELIGWFSSLGGSMSPTGTFQLQYSMAAMAGVAALAVGMVFFLGPYGQSGWEDRFAGLGETGPYRVESWMSEGDGGFGEYTMLRFRSIDTNRGWETLIDKMIEDQVPRGHVTNADGATSWVVLRATTDHERFEFWEELPASEANSGTKITIRDTSKRCVIGEVIAGSAENLDDASEGRPFKYCPSADESRFVFLR